MVPAVLLLLWTWSCCGSPWTYLLLWIIAAATPGGLLVGWTAQTTAVKLVGGPVSGFLGTFAAIVFAHMVTVATSKVRATGTRFPYGAYHLQRDRGSSPLKCGSW